jgi:hypothetical protein
LRQGAMAASNSATEAYKGKQSPCGAAAPDQQRQKA